MQKEFKSVIVATLLLSSTSLASTPIKSLPCGFEFTLGGVYLQPGANNLGWSATTTVLPIATPNWNINTIRPSYQPGFVIGGRYGIPDQEMDIQLQWLHLQTSDTDNVAVNPDSQWVSPFSQTGTPPTGGEITGVASLKTATGKVKFNYDVVNLDVGKFINLASLMQVRLFSGLSGIHLREKLISDFYGLPKIAFSLNNTSTYTGIGPRIGVDNIFHVYQNVNFVFQIAASVLFGKMQPAEYKFSGTGSDLALAGITTNNESISSHSETQVVPGIDTKIGLNFTFCPNQRTHFNLELGYMGAFYVNPLSSYETNTNVIALDSGSLSTSSVKHTSSNFSVMGPYVVISIML